MTTLKMPKIDKKIIKDRKKIIEDISGFTSRGNILTEIEELKPYETDGLTAYKQTPMLVVLPETTNEVSKILSYCNKRKIKVVQNFMNLKSAKAAAAVRGRDFVTPDDIQYVAEPVLNHRIILTPETEMEGATAEDVIAEIIQKIEVPR